MTRAFAPVACIPQTAGCPRRRQATGIPWLDYRLPKPPRRWGDHERHWYASASICGNNRVVQVGLTARDLEPFIGPSGRVSEVLNRKRALSLRMVKRLHDGLKIPYESLLTET